MRISDWSSDGCSSDLRMQLLIDMNLSPRWIDWFAGVGIEAVHWSMVGENNAPDSEIMAYASVNGYVVITHDLDFSTILAATHGEKRSEERRIGKACVSPCRSRLSPHHSNKNTN